MGASATREVEAVSRLLALSSLLACGDDTLSSDSASDSSSTDDAGSPSSSVQVATRCGVRGPVRIVPLAADETAWPVASSGDRVLVGIERFDGAFDYRPPFPAALGTTLVSVDACGQDERVVAEGLAFLYVPTASGEPLLGIDSADRLLWLDPDARRPARVVAAGATTILAIQGNDGALVEIDPRDGSQVMRRERVRSFEASKDGRWILWWAMPDVTEEDPVPRIWDRATDVEIEVATEWEPFSTKLGPGGVVTIQREGTHTQLTLFDDLAQVEIDGDYTIRAVGAEGTLLLESGNLSGYGDSYTLARDETTPTLRWDQRSLYTWADDDAFWLIAETTGAAASIFDPPDADTFANVIRMPYDTLRPEIVAPNLWEPLALPDGRRMDGGWARASMRATMSASSGCTNRAARSC